MGALLEQPDTVGKSVARIHGELGVLFYTFNSWSCMAYGFAPCSSYEPTPSMSDWIENIIELEKGFGPPWIFQE